MSPLSARPASLSLIHRVLVLPLLEVLTALCLTFLTRPAVQHPCWSVGRVRASVVGAPYGPLVPSDPHVVLVSTAGWQERIGAVSAPQRVPCLVRVTFTDGFEAEVKATASAWSEQAVQVNFFHPDRRGPFYKVWVPVVRVRRLPVP